MSEVCYWIICFGPVQSNTGASIFGFSEFIGALALMTLVYVITDARSKFRLAIAPGRLYQSTFVLILLIGVGTLVSDLWANESWWGMRVAWLNQSRWQAIFGVAFLGTFLTWVYFAFIRPPHFSRRNFKQFAQSLYGVLVRGVDDELAAIAHELTRSADSLVRIAMSEKPAKRRASQDVPATPSAPRYAHDILSLIANRKLCRHIVASSPATAILIVDAAAKYEAYIIPVGQFAVSVASEAIANPDSLLFHEEDSFSGGLLARIQPWSKALYGNFELVEGLARFNRSPLDIDYFEASNWTAKQFAAFSRSVVVTAKAYIRGSRRNTHSYALYRAIERIQNISDRMHGFNVGDGFYRAEPYECFRHAVDFVTEMMRLLEEAEEKPAYVLRIRQSAHEDIYDRLSELMAELVFTASTISGPQDLTWSVHYGTTWSHLFRRPEKGSVRRVVLHKARRRLYEEIKQMSEICANYKGAKILGFLLSVLGLEHRPIDSYKYDRPLATAVRAWARRHYLKMVRDFPEVAQATLIGTISFDAEQKRIVKTYSKGLERVAPQEFLDLLEPPPANE